MGTHITNQGKKRKAIFSLICSLFTATAAQAAFKASDAGTAGGQFLKMGADARGAAMGEAMGAAAEDASALYWNPAGLAALERRHAAATVGLLYQSVQAGFAAYAHPVTPTVEPVRRRELRASGLGTLAVGVLYLNAGQIKERDNTGALTGGEFSPRDAALLAGWGAAIGDVLDIGLGLKYVDSRIQGSARTGAVDAGMRLRFTLAEEWPYVLALSASNLGGTLRFREQSDPLPAILRVGQTLRPLKSWLISVDAVAPRDNAPYPAVGTEVSLTVGEEMSGALRGGWSQRTRWDLDGLSGISFGFAFNWSSLGIDYAWAPYGVLGQANRLTLNYRF